MAALDRSPGLRAISAEGLRATLASYPESVRNQGGALVRRLTASVQQQQERLASLSGALSGGDIQRGRELFFGNKKAICATCHAVQGSGGQIGPDLSIAVTDVQARFGRTIDDFFMNPTGTMSVVLSRQIILDAEQRKVAIGKLREAFAEYERLKAAGQDPLAASH